MEHLGRLLHAQASEEAQFDHPALPSVDRRQCLQRAIQRHHVQLPVPASATSPSSSVTRSRAAAAFAVPARPRVIDEHAPHQAGRNPEKVRAVLPADAPGVGQPEKRLVHQRRGLQGVAAPLAAHVPSSQAAQLRLHERRQLLERAIIAVAPRPQQFGDRPG